MSGRSRSRCAAALLGLAAAAAAGCTRSLADPALATRAYPYELHVVETMGESGEAVRAPRVIDIHAFRDGIWLELVNSTPRTYTDFGLWVNQRYLRHVDELPAGGRLRLSLFEFYDELGERFNAGGFWRSVEPSPVRLVQIQVSDHEALLGLIVVAEQED